MNENALPLITVELWYTLDEGATWELFGTDEDRHSPAVFTAPREGEFGVFLRLTNATGESSPKPTSGTPPQQRVLVDFSPPVAQLHAPKLIQSDGARVLQVHWSAVDSQLGLRPIELSYQTASQSPWTLLSPEPLGNTGRFDWRVPDELTGSIRLRMLVTDRGGHVSESLRENVDLGQGQGSVAQAASSAKAALSSEDLLLPGSKRTRERIAKLFAEAMLHRDRSEYAEGIAKLREVVRLDPMMTEAFSEMGFMLHRAGDLDKALGAFEIALKQRPNLRSALLGTALIHKQRSDFGAAAEKLRAILRYNPDDAEVWLNLGDVAVYRGDGVFARECYTRAAQINPQAKEMVEEANKRLALMAETSRRYKVSGK